MSDWDEAIKEMRKILLGMNSPGMDAEWRDACRTALSELEKLKRPAPLDGWVLVPREPTEAMIEAGYMTDMNTAWQSDNGNGRGVQTETVPIGIALLDTGMREIKEGIKAMYREIIAAAPASTEKAGGER